MRITTRKKAAARAGGLVSALAIAGLIGVGGASGANAIADRVDDEPSAPDHSGIEQWQGDMSQYTPEQSTLRDAIRAGVYAGGSSMASEMN